MRRPALAAAALLAWTGAAAALEAPQWPPPEDVAARMRQLQAILSDPQASGGEREAAREELSGLLKSPAGQQRGRTPDERPPRPARAAIDPFPSVVKPAERPPAAPPPAGVARVEVIEPPRPLVLPQTGAVTLPDGRFAIDPRTGHVLHPSGSGYVDPKTGQFHPK